MKRKVLVFLKREKIARDGCAKEVVVWWCWWRKVAGRADISSFGYLRGGSKEREGCPCFKRREKRWRCGDRMLGKKRDGAGGKVVS